MKFARLASFLTLLILSTITIPSRAALWEWTYSGIAYLPSGEKGIESVSYVWDPDDIVRGGPGNRCFSSYCAFFFAWAEGPAKFVKWHGLVNGARGPTTLLSWADAGPDIYSQLGGTSTFHVGPTFFVLAQPEFAYQLFAPTGTFEHFRFGEFDVFGGEDGWSWRPPQGFHDPADMILLLSLRPLGIPAPGTLALIVAALGVFAYTTRCRSRLNYAPASSRAAAR
jgi:hypothetical protein